MSEQAKPALETLDLFSLSDSDLAQYTGKPSLVSKFSTCQVNDDCTAPIEHLQTLTNFLHNCGHHFKTIIIQKIGRRAFLKNLLQSTPNLRSLDFRYSTPVQVYRVLKLVVKLVRNDNLQLLTSLKVTGISKTDTFAYTLDEAVLSLLTRLECSLKELELGNALGEDVKASTIERLLENQKDSLVSLIINGGFMGTPAPYAEKKLTINIPEMKFLKTLQIFPTYDHTVDLNGPGGNHQPIKCRFTANLPRLERLVLGNSVEVEGLDFSVIRKLTQFHCGSPWNLTLQLPQPEQGLLEAAVTSFQFPDRLQDPQFVVKVAKHFPNITAVWLGLPSAPVLRAFFKAFENSKLSQLFLATQFDIENTLESCILPKISDVSPNDVTTDNALKALEEYKYFDKFVKHFNVQLPLKTKDLLRGYSAGIGALKNLKELWMSHIPRKLKIPVPGEEKMWNDANCKFMPYTIGYEENYVLDDRAAQEIHRMNLQEFVLTDIKVSYSFIFLKWLN